MATAAEQPGSPDRRSFPAMGTRAEILAIDGDPDLIDDIGERLAQLEARWSRFIPDSDVARLRRAAGHPIAVSADTVTLVDHALAAARATGGLYDPGVGRALDRHGYDRTFAEVPTAAATRHVRPHVNGCWPAIEVDHEALRVTLPHGMAFDPGGIGKGLAADLVTAEFADRAAGLMLNLGGDLRMRGRAPHPAGWVVSVESPLDPEIEAGRLAIPEGAVATSSRLKRSWATADGPAHHVIDPRTGRPADTPVLAVTVIAADAWWAEVQATALLLSGPAALGTEGFHGIEAALWTDDGRTHTTPGLRELLA